MTLPAIIPAWDPAPAIAGPPPAAPGLFKAWTSSFLIHFYPARTGRLWLAISPLKAALIALLNLGLATLWLFLVSACVDAWNNSLLLAHGRIRGAFIEHPLREWLHIFQGLPADFLRNFLQFNLLERSSLVAGLVLLLIAAFAISFFLLLPFAARPGPNKPCVRHVVRSVLLATGFVHVWGPALAAFFALLIVYRVDPYFDVILGPLTLTLSMLGLWTFAALLTAAKADYRTSADFPQPRDPTCDECGYDLIAAEPAGRCPECGKPVAESVGPGVRPPTPWESRASLLNFRAIRNQLLSLVFHSRKLFTGMPTLTGQAAAHRWLLLFLLVIAAEASLISPAIYLALFSGVGLSLNVLWGGVLIGLTWGFLALMMVGIETAGIATFSRLKGHPVYLAAAAKVTAYSSPLMLFWVLLAAAQIIVALCAWDRGWFRPYTMRTEQIAMAISLSAAHIGGLLWYETTVYRGVRCIQFANR